MIEGVLFVFVVFGAGLLLLKRGWRESREEIERDRQRHRRRMQLYNIKRD